MKGKLRIFAMLLSLAMLFSAAAGQSEGASLSPAARFTVFVNTMNQYGDTSPYGPAVPMSDSPDENRLWLKMPIDTFFTGKMTLLIEDSMQEYLMFEPANYSVLENISDAGASLDSPSVTITYFDLVGDPAGVCYLYISSQDCPGAEEPFLNPFPEELTPETPLEQFTAAPIELPTEAPYELSTEAPAVSLTVTVRPL